jgi:hypothetical protein
MGDDCDMKEVCARPEFAGRIMCGFYPCSWKKIEKDKD